MPIGSARLNTASTGPVAIGRAIEERERERARARMTSGDNQYTEPSDKLSRGSGRTRDIVGAAVGMSGGTYEARESPAPDL
jgi:hypothetical protein